MVVPDQRQAGDGDGVPPTAKRKRRAAETLTVSLNIPRDVAIKSTIEILARDFQNPNRKGIKNEEEWRSELNSTLNFLGKTIGGFSPPYKPKREPSASVTAAVVGNSSRLGSRESVDSVNTTISNFLASPERAHDEAADPEASLAGGSPDIVEILLIDLTDDNDETQHQRPVRPNLQPVEMKTELPSEKVGVGNDDDKNEADQQPVQSNLMNPMSTELSLAEDDEFEEVQVVRVIPSKFNLKERKAKLMKILMGLTHPQLSQFAWIVSELRNEGILKKSTDEITQCLFVEQRVKSE